MTPENRSWIAVAAGAAAVLVLYGLFIVSPSLQRRKDLRVLIEKKQADLQEIRQLAADWEPVRRFEEKIFAARGGRNQAFSLLSFIENTARQVGVEQKIRSIRPISVDPFENGQPGMGLEVLLEDIDTRQLVRILEQLERPDVLLVIPRIKVKRTHSRIQAVIEITDVTPYSFSGSGTFFKGMGKTGNGKNR